MGPHITLFNWVQYSYVLYEIKLNTVEPVEDDFPLNTLYFSFNGSPGERLKRVLL